MRPEAARVVAKTEKAKKVSTQPCVSSKYGTPKQTTLCDFAAKNES